MSPAASSTASAGVADAGAEEDGATGVGTGTGDEAAIGAGVAGGVDPQDAGVVLASPNISTRLTAAPTRRPFTPPSLPQLMRDSWPRLGR